jgi:hypothetical protein
MNFRGKTGLGLVQKTVWPVLFALLLVNGCGEQRPPTERDAKAHTFKATAPHGGTAVPLGDNYQIEFVFDNATGKMDAYIFDDELENYVRIAAPSFDVKATTQAESAVLHFVAVANPATGETVGKTSQFAAQADWLKAANQFDGTIQEINLEGTGFKGILFKFAKGKDAHERHEN